MLADPARGQVVNREIWRKKPLRNYLYTWSTYLYKEGVDTNLGLEKKNRTEIRTTVLSPTARIRSTHDLLIDSGDPYTKNENYRKRRDLVKTLNGTVIRERERRKQCKETKHTHKETDKQRKKLRNSKHTPRSPSPPVHRGTIHLGSKYSPEKKEGRNEVEGRTEYEQRRAHSLPCPRPPRPPAPEPQRPAAW